MDRDTVTVTVNTEDHDTGKMEEEICGEVDEDQNQRNQNLATESVNLVMGGATHNNITYFLCGGKVNKDI